MEANELRINNWIIEPGQDENKPFQIFSIYHETGNNKVNGLPITYFKPIQLSEDWLIRFGFEPHKGMNDKYSYYTNDVFTFNTNHGWWIYRTRLDNQDLLQYVHQLQNLYFALTGTELTIKN